MKKKNIILGLIAFSLAIGSAFASLFVPTIIHVKGRLSQFAQVSCIPTNGKCNEGPFTCKVQVVVATGPSVTTFTYKDIFCNVPLTHTNGNAVVTTTSIYELVEF